jgi:hypothetical protein
VAIFGALGDRAGQAEACNGIGEALLGIRTAQRRECSSSHGQRFLANLWQWRSERREKMRCAWWS